MSLATRCSHCGTVFRVVQDQLKVSEGWVRCGRCNQVFNALEGLFDLERDAPPEWSPPAAPAPAPAARPAPAEEATPERDPTLVARIEAEVIANRPREGDPGRPSESPVWRPSASAPIGADDAPIVEPEFVRKAERQAQWRRSPHRAALAFAVLLLAAALALQWMHHFRDYAAARWPAATPLLASWCAQVGCTLGPLRRIEGIAVEASALARSSVPDAFRLSVTLRNRDVFALALPWIELSLTDSNGQLVARRALAPKDFRVAAPVIAPGAEQTLQLVLSAGGSRVSGYTVEIFYP